MFPIIVKNLLTQELYERYAWYLVLHNRGLQLYIGLMELVLFIFGISYLLEGNRVGFVVILLTMAGFFALFYFVFHFKIKNTYKNNPIMQDTEQEMLFYEEELTVKTKRGHVTYAYSDVTKIFETEHDFYIMVGKNTGLPLEKSVCSTELQSFLQDLKSRKA